MTMRDKVDVGLVCHGMLLFFAVIGEGAKIMMIRFIRVPAGRACVLRLQVSS
jgi:hypothetical protein